MCTSQYFISSPKHLLTPSKSVLRTVVRFYKVLEGFNAINSAEQQLVPRLGEMRFSKLSSLKKCLVLLYR